MKRTKKIVGDDGRIKVTVDIQINDRSSLMRHELNSMMAGLSSSIMQVIPSARHLDVHLSELVVK